MVVTVIVGAAITSVSNLLAEENGPPLAAVVLSVAVMPTVKVPACVGVPEITPLVSINPFGRPVAVKMCGEVPPEAVNAGAV